MASFTDKTNRPVIKIEPGCFDKLLETIAIAELVLLLGLTAWYYSSLPDIIPIHFDIAGKPDSFGGKGNILVLPVISVIVYIILSFANRYPHRFNYLSKITPENAEKQYRIASRMMRVLKVLVPLIFILIVFYTVQMAVGKSQGLPVILLPLVICTILFVVIYYIYQMSKKS